MKDRFDTWQEMCSEAKSCIFESEEMLSERERAEMREYLESIEDEIDHLEKIRASVGRILDYDKLKGKGFSREEVALFEREDSEYIAKVDMYYRDNLKKRKYMFGYPANMEDYSYTTTYLRHLESKMYLMNNCGDPYQKGNYSMDSKSTEKKIISLVAENFGIADGEYWGHPDHPGRFPDPLEGRELQSGRRRGPECGHRRAGEHSRHQEMRQQKNPDIRENVGIFL